MLNTEVSFKRIHNLIPKWSWNELKVGFERKLISSTDIIMYALSILSEDLEQFELVLALAIAGEVEVEEILFKLSSNEETYKLDYIELKWMFAIIYDAYMHMGDRVYIVIEDVYAEFGYNDEVSKLVGWMPCDDPRPMEVKVKEYIEKYKDIFNC